MLGCQGMMIVWYGCIVSPGIVSVTIGWRILGNNVNTGEITS